MNDPGTIYSDEEVECFSESEMSESEDNEEEVVSSGIEKDTFFNDFCEPADQEWQGTKTDTGLSKYFKSKKIRDISSLIERTREENIKQKEGAISQLPGTEFLSDDEDTEDINNVDNQDTVKFREKDVKKKENLKIRLEEEEKATLQKDKELYNFEDIAPVKTDITFLEMNLSTPLLKAIANMNYTDPTPIQATTIPVALKGRDICGCSQTGTGKTAAFMLPILQRMLFRPSKDAVTRVLVLVPTRELGIQVFQVSKQLAQFSDLTVALSVGGLHMSTQAEELQTNPDIIIATPGRLIDHIHNTPTFSLKDIEVLVLDEADRMLDEFFAEQLNEIVRQCCVTRQTMLFSATMTDNVKDLANVSLKNPVRVFVNSNTQTAQNLREEFVRLPKRNKENRVAILIYLLTKHFQESTLVFVQTKDECHRLYIMFGLLGLKCGELHGSLKQNERCRSLQKFKNNEINILFATDIAARGLDIKGVKTVINYTVPKSYEMYVHRVGRTARAGYSGRSITISFDSGDEYAMLRQIQKNAKSPLFQRVVSTNNISKCSKIMEKLEPLVEQVIKDEEEVRNITIADSSIEAVQSIVQRASEIEGKNKTQLKVTESELDKLIKEKRKLEMIIAGTVSKNSIERQTRRDNIAQGKYRNYKSKGNQAKGNRGKFNKKDKENNRKQFKNFKAGDEKGKKSFKKGRTDNVKRKANFDDGATANKKPRNFPNKSKKNNSRPQKSNKKGTNFGRK